MALHSLSRSLPKTLTLASFLSRSFATSNAAASSRSAISSLSLLRPLAAAGVALRCVSFAAPLRGFATGATSSSLNDPNPPTLSNRPSKEIKLFDGCDCERWMVCVDKPKGNPTRGESIDSYIKTLAKVIGSEEEARMKIYSVYTGYLGIYAFGALVSEEISCKLKEVPGVRFVLTDLDWDLENKESGGEPFVNGFAVPYDPTYRIKWKRNNGWSNDRPRNFDRSRHFERWENMQNRDFQNRP